MAQFNPHNGMSDEEIQSFVGPGAVERQVRAAVDLCWMMMPKDKRTTDFVEAEIKRVVEEVFRNIRAVQASQANP